MPDLAKLENIARKEFADIVTDMIYTLILNRDTLEVKAPADSPYRATKIGYQRPQSSRPTHLL